MVTVEKLMEMYKKDKVNFYKDAWAMGYVSRKGNGYVEEYSGKYGKGYIWHRPTSQSTWYHVIEYYLLPKTLKGKKIRNRKNRF